MLEEQKILESYDLFLILEIGIFRLYVQGQDIRKQGRENKWDIPRQCCCCSFCKHYQLTKLLNLQIHKHVLSNRGYLLLYEIIALSKVIEYRNGKDVQGSLLIQCSVFCWCQNCTEYEEQIQQKNKVITDY